MRSTARGSALVALATCLGACASAPTQLIVVVDTDLALGGQVDSVSVAVTGPTGMSEEEQITVGAGDRELLPLTLGVSPSGDALGPIDVVATAELDGTVVVVRRHRVTLVRGESRMLLLHLTAECAARATPCAASETCGENGCTPVEVEPSALPAWSGTPPRIGDDAGSPSMDAGRDAARGDADLPDADRPDATTACGGPEDCDDGNPCTADSCRATGCAHEPNAIACDDGVFCNGLDTCADGACGVHAGAPCVGATVCDEAGDQCTGCTADADCPAETIGSFGVCSFADACDEAGTESRTVTSFTCQAGACVAVERQESQACTRDTDGDRCASVSCGDYGACSGFSGTCGTAGMHSRTCSEGLCAAGSCATQTSTEMAACSRVTDGNECAPASCSGWSTCTGFSGACGESGTQTRTCSDPASCSGGACGTARTRTEMRACTRDTDGDSCGLASCTAWSACLGLGCSTSGSRTRSCSTPTCESGVCDSNTVEEMGSCTRVTDGNPCNDRAFCTSNDECSGGICRGIDNCGRDCFCNGTSCVPSGGGGSLCLIEAE